MGIHSAGMRRNAFLGSEVFIKKSILIFIICWILRILLLVITYDLPEDDFEAQSRDAGPRSLPRKLEETGDSRKIQQVCDFHWLFQTIMTGSKVNFNMALNSKHAQWAIQP